MAKEFQENPMMINRRNFTIMGGATLLAYLTGGCIGKDTAVEGTEALYQQGANPNVYTGEVPVSGNVADYVRFEGKKAIFDILDASTKKNGWVVDYSLWPKSDANDNVMNDGILSKPEIYAGVINDGQKLWEVVLFSPEFMADYTAMGIDRNPAATGVSEFKWGIKDKFKVGNYIRYEQLSEGVLFNLYEVPRVDSGIAFGSPEKEIGIVVRKAA